MDSAKDNLAKINYLNVNKQTDVLLLDFAKAFDKVPHERLCKKLSHYGVGGPRWIGNFLKIDFKLYIVGGP